MTEEEKQRLIYEDLCARFPYDVCIRKKVCHSYQTETLESIGIGQTDGQIYVNGYPLKKSIAYLRRITSVTEKEMSDYWRNVVCGEIKPSTWCYMHHIERNNFIDRGLAIEAPEGMYKTE